MSVFQDAPCVGRSWLFDSTSATDHQKAAAMCKTCPAFIACDNLLRQELDMAHTMQAAGGGPSGTWAGRLLGKKSKQVGRGYTNAREHGTDRGYYQHRYYGDRACEACRAEHARQQREYRNRKVS